MANEAELSPRLVSFHENPPYEQRLIVFYDFLGWKSHIERAGTDPKAIGTLRRTILRHSRASRLKKSLDIKVSTFSDNVVISQPLGDKNQMLLQQLAIFQLASAIGGFLVRGGVTIGDIVHDDEVVFGPGVNRAYHLENEVAKYPRIILDPSVTLMVETGDLAIKDPDGLWSLDPFTLQFCDHLRRAEVSGPRDDLSGELPTPKTRMRDHDSMSILAEALDALKVQIRSPVSDKNWEKIAWVYDKLADQLGVPPARSYPRVRPGD